MTDPDVPDAEIDDYGLTDEQWAEYVAMTAPADPDNRRRARAGEDDDLLPGAHTHQQVLAGDAMDQLRGGGWILRGALPAGQLVLMYGTPGSGKSVLALNMALSIVKGSSWLGHDNDIYIKQQRLGTVLYLAGEAPASHVKRRRGWLQHSGLSGAAANTDNLWLHPAPPPLHQPTNPATLDLIAYVKQMLPDVIVIDTLASCTQGMDEVSGPEMGKLLHVLNQMRETGATVLVIHHPNAGGTKSRGHTSLIGLMDGELMLEGSVIEPPISIRLTKPWRYTSSPPDGIVHRLAVAHVHVEPIHDGDDPDPHVPVFIDAADGDTSGPRRTAQLIDTLQVISTIAETVDGGKVSRSELWPVLERELGIAPHAVAGRVGELLRKGLLELHGGRGSSYTITDAGELVIDNPDTLTEPPLPDLGDF